MLHKISLGLLCFLFNLLIQGCNEQSPVAGSVLSNDTIYVNVISSDSLPLIPSADALNSKPTASYTSSLMLGSAQGYQSTILVRFAGIPDSLQTAEILSSEIILQPGRYIFGDSTINKLSFEIVELQKLWAPDATIDTLQQSGFLGVNSIGNFDGIIPLKDTMDAVKVAINNQVVSNWFKLKAQTKTDSLIYGIALKPNASSTVIRAFLRNTISTPNNPPIYLRVQLKKAGSQTIDTLTLSSAYDACFVKTPTPEKGSITTNCASGDYTGLNFSLKGLPTGIAIHGAYLTLTLNDAKCLTGNQYRDTIITAQFTDSIAGNILREYYGFSGTGKSTFEFSVLNSMVESILKRGTDGTLKIFPYVSRDRARVDRLVFHGPNDPDPAKRPRLKVIYSTRPKP